MDRISRFFEVVAPVSNAFDNGKQFAIVNIVVALCRCTLARIKGNPVPISVMELAYNARYHKSQGIGMEANWEI